MSKNIFLRASAAALAASLALAVAIPAFAQPPLMAGQDGYRGDDRDWNDDDRGRDDDWRRRKPDFQQMQRDCSRAGIQEAWNRNYYSAQYNNNPRLVESRYGWEMRGNMRLHGRKGYSYVDTICEANGRSNNVRIEFRR
jgi:hypothetical protein